MTPSRRILIIGGGISGLALAGSRAAAGDSVEVVEMQPEWQVTSSGITLKPPALRALDRLGLLPEVEKYGSPHHKFHHCNAAGDLIEEMDPDNLAGGDKPRVAGILRWDLHNILLKRATEAGAKFTMGETVTNVEDGDDAATVTFESGRTDTYDIVVAADGINSMMRDLVTPESAGRPEFTGIAVWRALVPLHPNVDTLTVFFGKNTAGANPVSDDQMYVFVMTPMPEPRFIGDDERVAGITEKLEGFTGTLADVRAQITDPAQVVVRPIYSVVVKPPWHKGRLVLMGDAVHAPPSTLAQGGGMAMEDAVVMSEVLDKDIPLEDAYAEYTERRAPRSAQTVQFTLEHLAALREGDGRKAGMIEAKANAALAQAL